MNKRKPRYHRHRFPPEIIAYAVWVYHRFCLSLRDVEDLLAERGIEVSYETIRRWGKKFGPRYRRSLKHREGRLGGKRQQINVLPNLMTRVRGELLVTPRLAARKARGNIVAIEIH